MRIAARSCTSALLLAITWWLTPAPVAADLTLTVDVPALEVVTGVGGTQLELAGPALHDPHGLPLLALAVAVDGVVTGVQVVGEGAEEVWIVAPLLAPEVAAVGDGAPPPRPAVAAIVPGGGELGRLRQPGVERLALGHGPAGALLQVMVRPVALRSVADGGYRLTHYRRLSIVIEQSPSAAGARIAAALASALPERGAVVEASAALDPHAVVEPQRSPAREIDPGRVELVIVTTELLATSFGRLAEWRAALGVRTRLVTVEWVTRHYEGADGAARIRAFLVDAHRAWGVRAVLLGGDTDQVPVRYLVSRYFLVDPSTARWEIPADLYYSALDGDFNGDGDAFFGEDGDQVDLVPELEVGRAPVSTLAEADFFVRRQLAYELGHGLRNDYPASVMLLAEVLFRRADGTPALGFDGAEFAENVVPHIPPAFGITRFYEQDSEIDHDTDLSPATGLGALSAGAGMVVHVGHGFRNTLSFGSGSVSNPDIDNLRNGSARPVFMALNCSSAAFDFNAIGERFLKNPRGGAIVYVGMSRFAFPTTASIYQEWFVRAAFQLGAGTVGAALASTREQLWSLDRGDLTAHRYTQYTINVLGDPLTPIFAARPAALVVRHEASVALDTATLDVGVRAGGGPAEGCVVTVRSTDGGVASATTGSGGVASVALTDLGPGVRTVTARRQGDLPAVSSLCTTGTAEPFLAVETLAVLRGALAAGETLELGTVVRNFGASTWSTGSVRLAVVSGPAFAVGSAAVVPAVAAGGRARVTGLFIDVAAEAASGDQIVVDLIFDSDDQTRVARRVLTIGQEAFVRRGPLIVDSGGDGRVDAGEEVQYRLVLANSGEVPAYGLTATAELVDLPAETPSSAGTVRLGRVRFGHLMPGEVTAAEPIIFSLDAGADPNALALAITYDRPLADPGGGQPLEREILDFVSPAAPGGLSARGSTTSVRLAWDASAEPDVLGYTVERSTALAGVFETVSGSDPVGDATFEDTALEPLTEYAYRVRAIDGSHNASAPSPLVTGVTNPPLAAGWPQSVGQETASSPLLFDLDADGAAEILVGGDAMYVWRGNGNEWRDGDDIATSSGLFSVDGVIEGRKGFHAAPAVADLDGDGEVDVIGVAWEEARVHAWSLGGRPLAGFPRSLIAPPNWGSPVIADLDGDLDLEVCVLSGNLGRVFAWHHDGSELADGDDDPATDGVLLQSGASFSFATPAAADLDGIAGSELVVGFDEPGGAVHALRSDGTSAPGWPVLLGAKISASPALVDLDGDSRLEVLVAAENDSVYALHADGGRVTGWPRAAAARNASARTSSPVAVDLDQDGGVEILFAASDGRMHVWRSDGTRLSGWESVLFAQDPDAQNARATQSTPVVGEVDGDGSLDVLLGAEDGKVYGWHADGTRLAGFPIQTGGEVRGSAALGDVDGDGRVEIVVAGWDKNLYVWHMGATVSDDSLPWPSFRGGPANRGIAHQLRGELSGEDVLVTATGGRLDAVRLGSPFPNPVRLAIGPASIPFDLSSAARARVSVFDAAGRLVARLFDAPCSAGTHCAHWDGRDERGVRVASGNYWVELRSGAVRQTAPVVVVR